MKWPPSLTTLVWTAVGVLAVAIQFFAWLEQEESTPSATNSEPEYREIFQRLAAVQLVKDDTNDGDSFRIAHAGGAHVFRLYFVDCAEKREYDLVSARLRDQASYFDGLSIPQTLLLGGKAAEFTTGLLRSGRFTLFTRWERVFQSDRYYAFVVFDDHEHLSEKLVRAGLCRIFTKGSRLPDGREVNDFDNVLRSLEREARAAKAGAWGMPKRVPAKRKK